METKEAVKWIFDTWHEWENVYGVDGEQVLKEGKKMDGVIELLKRGEKYKKMFLQIVNWEKEDRIIVKSDLDELKQKYFPKPSDNFTEKVMEKITIGELTGLGNIINGGKKE